MPLNSPDILISIQRDVFNLRVKGNTELWFIKRVVLLIFETRYFNILLYDCLLQLVVAKEFVPIAFREELPRAGMGLLTTDNVCLYVFYHCHYFEGGYLWSLI